MPHLMADSSSASSTLAGTIDSAVITTTSFQIILQVSFTS